MKTIINKKRRAGTTIMWSLALWFTPAVAFAQENSEVAGEIQLAIWRSVAAAACIAIAATAGAFAQSKAAQTALEGIARNPGASGKIFTPMLLGLALIESLVIYALIISFILAT